MHKKQRGMTLLEVLLAVVVLAVGSMTAAALQLKALQATEAARRDGQSAMEAHSEHERRQQ
ncbi:prepilin-type N-terminal cleavage/methylation domain-containing protein [Pseudomonas sp. PSKL.D1]|uniref:prepilin-type N-terminal cleavage/methylation domain-containing protein n=1 Tax=Pseudomonas sp. PSKL.D1 TaxID=3029060 RepID=UPI0023811BBF|nr:prepilin-type N-terminal cleavage/methylation domain-containing protein [Pseudomonas sp. PSKL.D1]WDY57388.1 prepilin-type N-terminal cleavage/methylation domain-containing protein [Pseudomonas sp. PSKL.D1]